MSPVIIVLPEARLAPNGKGAKLGEGAGAKLGEGKGAKLGEGERD